MRLEEEAPPAVHEPEPHRAVHEPVVPGHPQVGIGDREPEDLVITHAIVFRHDDLDRVAAQLQLPAQPEDHLSQPARLRHRRALGRNHHHEHGRPPNKPGGTSRAVREINPRHGTASSAAPPRPRYLALPLAGLAAGAAAFCAVRAGAAFFAASFFPGVLLAAGGTGPASTVRSTTESSPPKSLRT